MCVINIHLPLRTKHLFHQDDWMNRSKTRYREKTIWQRQFWERQIRDDSDYQTHVDYIHWSQATSWKLCTLVQGFSQFVVKESQLNRVSGLSVQEQPMYFYCIVVEFNPVKHGLVGDAHLQG